MSVMGNIIKELVFGIAAFVVLILLMLILVIPFLVRYSQNFLMYRNRFRIETDIYQTFWRKISFYDSIILTIRLYALQEMS